MFFRSVFESEAEKQSMISDLSYVIALTGDFEIPKANVSDFVGDLFETMEKNGADMTNIDIKLGDGKQFWEAVSRLDYWRGTFKNARIHLWN